MLVGHFAVGMAAKRIAPSISVGTLVLAAVLADLLCFAFLIAGLEQVEFRQAMGAGNYFRASNIPFSHSLLMDAVWGALLVLLPDSSSTVPALSRLAVRGRADQSGSYTSPPLMPAKYRVLATTQTIRWNVPEDLEKVLLAMLQAKSVEVAPKAKAHVAVEPVAIY